MQPSNSPDTNRSTAGIISLILAGLNAIGLVLSLSYSLYMRSRFMALFDDFGVSLPVATRLILSTPVWIWLLAAVGILAVLIVKELIPRKWITLLLNGLFFLFGIIYWAIFSIAMFLPLTKMGQQLNAP